MTIGDYSTFALESGISVAYERRTAMALGFFVIHVGGRSYGVREPGATMLACSLDGVQRRISKRGLHTAPFSGIDAADVAKAFRRAIYADAADAFYLGIGSAEFRMYFAESGHDIMWAPDGDCPDPIRVPTRTYSPAALN